MKMRGSSLVRVVDRYVGICLVILLAILRRIFFGKRQLDKLEKIESVAILKSVAIGDTVLLLPVIDAFKKAYPDCKIDIFCGPSNTAFAKLIPKVNSVIPLPITNPMKCFSILNKKKYNVVIDFGQWPRIDAIYGSFISSELYLGFKAKGQYRHFLYDKYSYHREDRHEQLNFNELTMLSGINMKLDALPILSMPNNNESTSDYIVVHLWPGGSQRFAKEWPNTYWIEFFKKLSDNFSGLKIFLTGSPDDYEKNQKVIYGASALVKSGVLVNKAGLSLVDSINCIQNARAVISVDTGILHIASALDVKLLGLHGPTHSKRWGAQSKNSISIDACNDINEAPITLGFEKTQEDFMSRISVDHVFKEVSRLLSDEVL